jgi:formate/nitrite transporter
MSGVWPYGITRILAGVTFSLGLILVVIGGAELFTGNSLMIIALLNHKITFLSLLRNWGLVYVANFLGSMLIAFLVIYSRMYAFAGGELGKSMLTVANNKTNFTFLQAIILGILCNILVCLAVWLTYSTKNTGGKILAIVFPISAFIAAGFEHSVANMYILPVGLLLKSIDPVFVAGLKLDLSSLTWINAMLYNLLPVTLGNIIGGAGFVGLLYYLIYRK